MPITKPSSHQDTDYEASEYKSEKPKIFEVRDFLHDRYQIRYNEVRTYFEMKQRGKKNSKWQMMDDFTVTNLWIDCEAEGFKPGGKSVPESLLQKAIFNTRFSPVFNAIQSYFDKLPAWDGINHIKKLADIVEVNDAIKTPQAPLSQLWPKLFQKWLICCVSSALGRSPNQVMLLLLGPQGKGKTTFANTLAPDQIIEHYFSGHIDPTLNNTQTCDLLAEMFLINLDDQLDNILEKDPNSIKAVISTAQVSNRKSYARFAKRRQRRASFIGSVNNPDIFSDKENRRYLCIEIAEQSANMVEPLSKVDIDKVWSQALHLLNQGEIAFFTKDEEFIMNYINDQYLQVSMEHELLVSMFAPALKENPTTDFYTTTEILASLNKASGLKLSVRNLSRALRNPKLGYEQIQRRKNGVPRLVYPMTRVAPGEDKYNKEKKQVSK